MKVFVVTDFFVIASLKSCLLFETTVYLVLLNQVTEDV